MKPLVWLIPLALGVLTACAGAPPRVEAPEAPVERPRLGEGTSSALTAPSRLARAEEAFEKGDYGTAAAEARAALTLQPGLNGARRLEARARRAMGDLAGAYPLWEEQVAGGASDYEALEALASLADRLGLGERALVTLDRTPETPDRWGVTGWLALRMGDPEDAARRLARVGDGPEAARYRGLLARACLATGDLDGAAAALAAPGAVEPTDAGLWTLRGDLDRTRGLAASAAMAYRKALELDPTHLPALVGQGLLALQQGKPASAAERFEAAVALDGDRPEVWNDLAVARRRAGNLAGAREALERALVLETDFPPALKNLGILNEKYLGRPREGARFYERYLVRKPGDEEVERWRKAALRKAEELKP